MTASVEDICGWVTELGELLRRRYLLIVAVDVIPTVLATHGHGMTFATAHVGYFNDVCYPFSRRVQLKNFGCIATHVNPKSFHCFFPFRISKPEIHADTLQMLVGFSPEIATTKRRLWLDSSWVIIIKPSRLCEI
jgi:hypothetical protein